MIKERYVSFEVASLLRDKGFEIAIDAPHLQIPAPTQAMACDWIEETFNISIEVWVGIIGYGVSISYALKDPNIASNDVKHKDDMPCGDNSDGSWSSKELVYNAALKYVLINLV